MSKLKVYDCEYCDNEFESKQLIIEHKKECAYKCNDFECSFCSVCFPSKKLLVNHVNKCKERKRYVCYGCEAYFFSKSDLNYHEGKCKSALRKCNWMTKQNKKCNFTGKYEGFCKKHYVGYKYYDPEGVGDICSVNVKIKYKPSTISHMITGEFYSLEYVNSNSTYIMKKHNNTNIIMENIETKENIIFWESKDVRKHKPGKLITQLTADYEYECENNALVEFGDDNKMCKKCFESQYNNSIDSLIIRKK